MQRGPSPDSGAALSAREDQILRCLIRGASNKLIARDLGITEGTVKVHIKSLLRKMGATNRTQAAIWGIDRGLLRTEPAQAAAYGLGRGSLEPKVVQFPKP